MSRTVLITGATGTVSGALMDALSDVDVDVRALVRDEAKAQGIESRGVQVRVADLGTPESLPGAFEGVNDLWLLNANSPRAPENSINAVWAARHAGVQRVVRMSVFGAAHDAPTRSGRLHALADHQLQSSGLRWTILRPQYLMQNLLGSLDTIIEQNAFYLNAGEGRIGAIDARDVAEIAAKILTDQPDHHHAKIYTPTGPEAITFAHAAGQLQQATGNDVSYVSVPDDTARQSMLDAGVSHWLAGMLVEYGQAFSTGWSDCTTNHVKELLGRPPRRFADFARDHAAAFTSQR